MSSPPLTPEEHLLIPLCRLEFSEAQRAGITGYIGQVNDWKHFVWLANEHGVIALVASNLRELGAAGKIPRDAMAALENGYMQSLVRNTWLTERWKEVNTILCNTGISHILLKGMALEHTLYGFRGLRQMTDNDILLRRSDALRAWYLLQKEGYKPEPLKSPLFRKLIFIAGHHLPALYKDGYALEIHEELPGKEEGYDPFENAVEFTIDGTKALMLSVEDNLEFLKSHFLRHAEEGICQLRMYADIVLLGSDVPGGMPVHFIQKPDRSDEPKYRKAAYRRTLMYLPARYRLRWLVGDIFPSLQWMKKRYGCTWAKALLRYPGRVGKVVWLISF